MELELGKTDMHRKREGSTTTRANDRFSYLILYTTEILAQEASMLWIEILPSI